MATVFPPLVYDAKCAKPSLGRVAGAGHSRLNGLGQNESDGGEDLRL